MVERNIIGFFGDEVLDWAIVIFGVSFMPSMDYDFTLFRKQFQLDRPKISNTSFNHPQKIAEILMYLFITFKTKKVSMPSLTPILRKMSFSADMFKAPACLRARGEPEVSRLCPGIVSVLLGIFFIYMFMDNLFKMIQYKQMKTSTVYETEKNLTLPAFGEMRVSISPAWEDYRVWSKLFSIDIVLVQLTENGTTMHPLQLQQCIPEQWPDFPSFDTAYVMKQNICIRSPSQVQLQGTNIYTPIKYLQIKISKCRNTTGQCYSPQNFALQMERMYRKRYNYFSLYLVDTSINVKKQNPIQRRLTLDYNFMYSNLTRRDLEIYLGIYEIETDHSIFPVVEDIEKVTGCYISESTENIVYKNIENQYAEESYGTINIYMSTNRKLYKRKRGKIDQVFSYAGGLFGLIVSVFSIFLYSYNKYCYQLLVAEHSFNYDESGQKVRFKYFTFLKYVKFQIFDWLKNLVYEPNWPECKMIGQTKDQANLYMDVRYLFRKIRLTEVGIRKILSENQEKILYLSEPPMIKEVEKRRTYLEYYNAVIEGKLALNIQDLKTQQVEINLIIQNLIGSHANPQNPQTPSAPIDQTSVLQFQKTLKTNLQISDQKILASLCRFQDLYQQTKKLALPDQLLEAEQKFANAYRTASHQIRNQLVDTIPLKILFRLCEKIGELGERERKEQDGWRKDETEQRESQKERERERKENERKDSQFCDDSIQV